MTERRANQRGMAFILAMVAVLIISALMGGVLMLSTSHYSLSSTNSDYAVALNTAEAGVNYELHWINDNLNNPTNLGHQQDASYAESADLVTGYRSSFQVYVTDLSGGNWVAPNDLLVHSTGAVARVDPGGNAISTVQRTVVVQVRGNQLTGPNGIYALFGINSLDCGGNLTVNGASGTGGSLNLRGGSIDFNGNFNYCGTTPGELEPNDPRIEGYDVLYNGVKEVFLTVNELADQRAQVAFPTEYNDPGAERGINFFRTTNNNLPLPGVHPGIVDTQGNPVSVKRTPNAPPRLNRDAFTNACTDTRRTLPDGSTNPFYNRRVIVLNPGDYYFELMDINAQYGLDIRNTGGPVNIWLGAEAATGSGQYRQDQINGGSQLTSNQSGGMFNIYEGSQRPFILNGNTQAGSPNNFYGSVYAYNITDGTAYGDITLTGHANVWGSVIGYDVSKAQGTGTITFPSMGGGDLPPGNPGDFFGFTQRWSEQ